MLYLTHENIVNDSLLKYMYSELFLLERLKDLLRTINPLILYSLRPMVFMKSSYFGFKRNCLIFTHNLFLPKYTFLPCFYYYHSKLVMQEILYSPGRGSRKFQKGNPTGNYITYTFSLYIKNFPFTFYYFKVHIKFFPSSWQLMNLKKENKMFYHYYQLYFAKEQH